MCCLDLELALLPALELLGVLDTLGVLLVWKLKYGLHQSVSSPAYICRAVSLVPHGVRADLPYFCAGALPGERPGALGEAGVVIVVQREL